MKRTRALKLVNAVQKQNPSYVCATVRESKKVTRKLIFDGDNDNDNINHLTSSQDVNNDTQIAADRTEQWVEQQAKHTKRGQNKVLNTTELNSTEVPPASSCLANSILVIPLEEKNSNVVSTPAVSETQYIENVQQVPKSSGHSATLIPVSSSEVCVYNVFSTPAKREPKYVEHFHEVSNSSCHPTTLITVIESDVSLDSNISKRQYIENVLQVPNSPCHSATLIPVPLSEVSVDNDLSTPAKSEPENLENVQQVFGGRKRNIINKKKLKQLQKNKITTEWTLNYCGHTAESKKCNCKVYNLSFEDMNTLRKNISTIKSKIDQDKYVLKMMVVNHAKDTRRHSTQRAVRTLVEYYLPSIIGERIPVCATVFRNVTSFTRRRLNLLTSTFKKEQRSPIEKRGGSRLNERSEEVTESIKGFIMKMKCQTSPYTRNDTGKSYLPPEITVKSLWEHWKEERIKNEKPVASISKFHRVFKQTIII